MSARLKASTELEPGLAQWVSFLEDYAAGRSFSEIPSIPPYLSNGSLAKASSTGLHAFTFEAPLYDSTTITPEVARQVQRFYIANGFLPPPRHPLEHLRSEIIHDYDLHSRQQVNCVQATLNVLQAFYGGVAAFTLFEKNVQSLHAVSGPPDLLKKLDLYPGKRIIPETSLCGHASLSNVAVFLPDFRQDWRFQRNPFTAGATSPAAKQLINTQESLVAYLGIPVTLRLDPASTTNMSVVPIGVINILIIDPTSGERASSPGQTMVLGEITRMLQTQLRATWDCNKQSLDARARRTVADFIEQTLVRPCAQRITDDLEGRGPQADSLKEFAQSACKQICRVLSADTATIIDLRLLGGSDDHVDSGNASFLAFDGDSSAVDQIRANIQIADARTALSTFLLQRTADASCDFDLESDLSGLESLLPRGTTSHLIIPFRSSGTTVRAGPNDQYVFLIAVTSSRPGYHFRSAETTFVKSMGSILRAHWLQSRVVEADAAKTRFLSSISHELRTPLHCIVNGVGLLQEAMHSGDSAQCDEYLNLVNQSSVLLEQILNSVLDYGSITQTTSQMDQLEEFDLSEAVTLAVQTSLPRMHPEVKGEKDVEIFVEFETRDWVVKSDATAFKRILVNGVTNAMKATTHGRITVKLEASPSNDRIICKVVDSGRGIPAEIADKVFLPFVKGDAWTPGAGLGLNITQGLVNRMKGTVQLLPNPERGMSFIIELPMVLRTPSAEERPASPSWIQQAIHRNMTLTEYTVAPSGRILKTLMRSDSDASASDSNIESDSSQSDNIPVTPETSASGLDLLDNRIRVLVVDDNDIGRKLAKRAIAKCNVIIQEANDGLQAFEVFKTFAPHLVLTDIGMPVDGITASKMMRNYETQKNRKPARIYAITGLGATDSRLAEDGLQGPARLDGWLTKGKHGFEDFRKIVSETSSALGLGARPGSPLRDVHAYTLEGRSNDKSATSTDTRRTVSDGPLQLRIPSTAP